MKAGARLGRQSELRETIRIARGGGVGVGVGVGDESNRCDVRLLAFFV